MRIENTTSFDRTIAIKAIDSLENHGGSGKPAINREVLLRDLPKNFSTMDPKKFEPVTIGELEFIEAIERANNTLKGINTNFEFSIHEETRAIMVKVINSDTQEIIREIPPEKILDMVAKMWEVVGIFVDRQI